MIYGPSLSCSSTWTTSPCYPAQEVNLSKLSDGYSVHTGEPLPYQSEPKSFPKGDEVFLWTYRTRYVSDDLGNMVKAGIVDCAFIVTARRSVLLEFTHLLCCLLSEAYL